MLKLTLLVVCLAYVTDGRLTPAECVAPFATMKQCAKVSAARRRMVSQSAL